MNLKLILKWINLYTTKDLAKAEIIDFNGQQMVYTFIPLLFKIQFCGTLGKLKFIRLYKNIYFYPILLTHMFRKS